MPIDNLDNQNAFETKVQTHVIFTDLDGQEGVLVDLNTKKYYQLNETAMVIWRDLEKGLSVDKIADDLTTSYDVTSDRAAGSVARLIQTLHSLRLTV
jgi:hypothetical protein